MAFRSALASHKPDHTGNFCGRLFSEPGFRYPEQTLLPMGFLAFYLVALPMGHPAPIATFTRHFVGFMAPPDLSHGSPQPALYRSLSLDEPSGTHPAAPAQRKGHSLLNHASQRFTLAGPRIVDRRIHPHRAGLALFHLSI